jgi:hypothetical protein
MRRFPARSYATRCASSWRKVRSTSLSEMLSRAGFNSMMASGQVARPAVDRMRVFQCTETRSANLDNPSSRHAPLARAESNPSPPLGIGRIETLRLSNRLSASENENCICRTACSTAGVSTQAALNSRTERPQCSSSHPSWGKSTTSSWSIPRALSGASARSVPRDKLPPRLDRSPNIC